MKGIMMTYLRNYFNYIFMPFILAAVLVSWPHISRAQDHALHPLESYTVKYRIEGNTVGEKTQFSKDHGRTLCWKEVSEITMPDVGTVKKNEKIVTWIEGGEQWIVTINLDDNTGTRIKNPMFAQMYEMMKGKDPKEFSRQFMMDMGGKVTGRKTVNGEKCEVWQIGGGATACVTDDLITVETTADIESIKIRETAVEVKRNSSEPDGICDISGAKITETDLSEMMRQRPQGD